MLKRNWDRRRRAEPRPARRWRRALLPLLALLPLCGGLGGLAQVAGAELPQLDGAHFEARDTLAAPQDDRPDARESLQYLGWSPAAFEVRCEKASDWQHDFVIRFPSAIDTGNQINDSVACEWHMARDGKGELVAAPAIVVVHESGRGMTVGKLFAFSFSRQGLHAFLVQLPGYGLRRGDRPEEVPQFVQMLRQAIADVRRARDAVVALPSVENSHIALQGTSLGGMVAASAGALDRGFDSVFLMLAGGDLFDIIQQGDRDAANLRRDLERHGLAGDRLREVIATVEPNRLAHRLDPRATWLFSGRTDTVVPLKNATSLARAAALGVDHHVILEADHYSGITLLPQMVQRVRGEIDGLMGGGSRQPPAAAPGASSSSG